MMCGCKNFSTDPDTLYALRFLIDQTLAAHERRQPHFAKGYARCAEALLCCVFADRASSISKACSRKGQGQQLAEDLAKALCHECIALVSTVLLLRGARRPVVTALALRTGGSTRYEQFVMGLCWRAFHPALTK